MGKTRSFTVLLCLLFLLTLVSQVSFGQGGVKAADKLTKAEVQKALESGQLCFNVEGYGHFCGSEVEKGTLNVIGVQTDGSMATVYYEFVPIKKRQVSIFEFKPHYNKPHPPRKTEMGPVINGRLSLIRFDDGTWFAPFQDKFLTK